MIPQITEPQKDDFYDNMQTLVTGLGLGKVDDKSRRFIEKWCRIWCPDHTSEAVNLFLLHLWRFPKVIIQSPSHAKKVVRRLVYRSENDCFTRHLAKSKTEIKYLDTRETKITVIPRHQLEKTLKNTKEPNMIELHEIYVADDFEEPYDFPVELNQQVYLDFVFACLENLDPDIALAAHVYFANLSLPKMAAHSTNPKKRLKELRRSCRVGKEKMLSQYLVL